MSGYFGVSTCQSKTAIMKMKVFVRLGPKMDK